MTVFAPLSGTFRPSYRHARPPRLAHEAGAAAAFETNIALGKAAAEGGKQAADYEISCSKNPGGGGKIPGTALLSHNALNRPQDKFAITTSRYVA
jgi:hypothetical protein